ncbi:MAG TPA: FAD-binding oxidoreductase [Verrucomicrobiae bacterium]|nr:FAD-binding oxidoreductase [Verrucomicrobiae bacterium]
MAVAVIEMPISRVVQETPDTRTFRLEPPPDFPMNWQPGQFITIYLPDDPKTRRAYSLSSSPLDGHYLEITIKRMGNFGTRVYETGVVGTRTMAIPPRGKFVLPADPSVPVMLISGGSGVTPYRSMMRYLVQKKLPTRVVNLYSVRLPEDIIFKDEFEHLCALNPNFRFLVTCTRLPPEDNSWTGFRGRINPNMVRKCTEDIGRTVYYSCGSHEFVIGTAAMLHDMGLPKERVIYEDWG